MTKRQLKASIRRAIANIRTQKEYEELGARIIACEIQGYITFDESFKYIMDLSKQLLQLRDAGILEV